MINIAALTFASSVVLALVVHELRASRRNKSIRGSTVTAPRLTLALISDFYYDDFNQDSEDKVEKTELDYFEKNTTIKEYIDLFLAGDYEKEHEETILLYLICVLGKHPRTKLFKCKIDDLTSILRFKYNMIIPKENLLHYKVLQCYRDTEPTYNIFRLENDCLDEDEYRAIYSYYLKNINSDFITADYKVMLILFLLRSRFAGRYSHNTLDYINYDELILNFVKYADIAKATNASFFTRYTKYSVSYGDFMSIYQHYKSKANNIKKRYRALYYQSLDCSNTSEKLHYYEDILGVAHKSYSSEVKMLAMIDYYEQILGLQNRES